MSVPTGKQPNEAGNYGRTVSGDIFERVTERSRRLTTPRIVRTWIAPMAIVVAVAMLFSTGLYVVDLLFLGGQSAGIGVVEHYLTFNPQFITDALPALGTTIVAALGIVLTVIAIIVQLSSERYTGVAMMFLRDPVHIAVLSFYVVASLCAVWLSVTLQADFVPRSLLLLVMTLTSLGLASMLPYFAYTFWFLEPGNIIERLRMRTTLMVHRGLASGSTENIDKLQGAVLQLLEEIADIANNSIDGRDKIIAGDAVDALRDFALDYIARRPDEDRAWLRMGRNVLGDPDFIGIDRELLAELDSQRLWVEWKTLQQCVGIYHEALGSMQEINALVAIDTRYIGEVAAVHSRPELVRMVFRFMNSYLRSAIEAGNSRTVGDVLNQYRVLLEHLLQLGETDAACEGVAFMQYYGHIAFEEDLPAVSETVAYDVAALCRYAHSHGAKGENRIRRQLLDLDEERPTESHRQQRSLIGVRLAQTKLAIYYLSADEEGKARMIADDMRDMTPDALRFLRYELLQAPPPHSWEIVDRGRNLHYLREGERAQLDRFLGWLGAAPELG